MSAVLTKYMWSNWIQDYKRTDLEIARPTTTNQLRDCMQHAVDSNKKIRAIGSGHSMSSASRPHDIAIDLKQLYKKEGRHRELSNSSLLRRPIPGLAAGERVIRVSGGVTIKELNRHILAPRKMALINMGNYDGQTLSGAINTATHGTGIHLKSLADMVLSVELMTIVCEAGRPVVKRIRIEPTNGITHPKEFNAQFGKSDFNLLMQNDALFYSAVASYGTMGIAAAYTLKVTGEYWLEHSSEKIQWSALKSNLDDLTNGVPSILNNVRHSSFFINLAQVQTQELNSITDPFCLVVEHSDIADQTKPAGWPPSTTWPPERTGFGDDIQFNQIINPEDRHKDLGGIISNGYGTLSGCKPFKHEKTASISYIVLRRLRDKNSSDYDHVPTAPPKGLSIDIAVPIEKLQSAIDATISFARNQTELRLVVLGVRFVAESDHYLTPMYGRKCAMLELVVKLTFPHNKDRIAEVRDDIAKPLILEPLENLLCYNEEFEGIPHLGKHNTLNFERLNDPKNFPKFREWLVTYQLFNSFGFFDNTYTDQLGLSSFISKIPIGDNCLDNWPTVFSKSALDGFFNELKGKIQPVNQTGPKPTIRRRKG